MLGIFSWKHLKISYRLSGSRREVFLQNTINKNVFESGTENPDNLGFCPDGICTRSGLLNLTKCAETQTGFAAPVFISQPHFLNADRSLMDEIAGMEPDEANHQTYLVVDPLTGFIKNAAKRFQINIQTTAGDFFKKNKLTLQRRLQA